jgi:hypothetical protein
VCVCGSKGGRCNSYEREFLAFTFLQRANQTRIIQEIRCHETRFDGLDVVGDLREALCALCDRSAKRSNVTRLDVAQDAARQS